MENVFLDANVLQYVLYNVTFNEDFVKFINHLYLCHLL